MTVQIFEEHAAVLADWWSRPKPPRTVIYLDAHLDLQQLSDERLARLDSCATAQQLVGLAKPHHLLPDRGYSYGIEDFLQPARRLGLLEHLVWVAPPHVPIKLSLPLFEHLEQMDGVSFDELAAFRPDSTGVLRGRLLDIELTICRYEQLPELTLPSDCVLDVDMDYFVAVPGDRVWVDPRSVFDVLESLAFDRSRITLTRSVSSGFMPLRERFLADYLASLFEGDDAESIRYQQLFRALSAVESGRREEASALLVRSLRDGPACSATHHLMSLAAVSPGDSERHRAAAEEACLHYRAWEERFGSHPELALDIGRLSLESSE